jgi:tRNA pseudouridine13 synthase
MSLDGPHAPALSNQLPFATSDVEGCGGHARVKSEDFEVEEIPAYSPSGEGEHLFLWVEKRDRSTHEVARLLADALGLGVGEVSSAGLKDRHAHTWQALCVPARVEGRVGAFEHPDVRVHWARRHSNKLRTGHLRGNHFRLRVRGVRAPERAGEVLGRLAALGLPNYFGEQRFGLRGDNAPRGRALLEQGGARGVSRFQRRLYLSAFQSHLFNLALAERLESGTLGRALAGDVLKKHPTGGEFLCELPEQEQPRVDAFEVGPAGPLFGPRMRASAGEVAEREAALLAREGIGPELFTRGGGETKGARRLYRVPVEGLQSAFEGEDLCLSFTLPAGSYATGVLRELLKPGAGQGRLEDTESR